MEKKGVIIQGSAKSLGHTNKIANFVRDNTGFEIIDLKEKNIGHFEYDFRNVDDDFLPLMRSIVVNYQTIVFATPVYWYSMSGIMKDFFDRITDLLKTEKDLGRQLRGKNMALISCGSDSTLQNGFTMPFIESANYLGMNYVGDVHTWIEDEKIPDQLIEKLNDFSSKLL
jgi:multimeric flavodoxin WrbA